MPPSSMLCTRDPVHLLSSVSLHSAHFITLFPHWQRSGCTSSYLDTALSPLVLGFQPLTPNLRRHSPICISAYCPSTAPGGLKAEPKFCAVAVFRLSFHQQLSHLRQTSLTLPRSFLPPGSSCFCPHHHLCLCSWYPRDLLPR